MASPATVLMPQRPSTRDDFEIAIICPLTLEADAVEAHFDVYWDYEGPPFDKAVGDPNAYSTGAIGRHNVVLAHMPGMGTVNAAIVANNCRSSFPNIRLALVVGVTGVVPFGPGGVEIILGDVIISDGVIQYDLGRRLPGYFARKDTLLDSLGRPTVEIRSLLAKLKGFRGRKQMAAAMCSHLASLQLDPQLAAEYPGVAHDKLFEAEYIHIGDQEPCDKVGCNGMLLKRRRLDVANPQPAVHFGLTASGNSVMKSGKDRDEIAESEGVIAFEMEGAGIWDTFPCVVIKGACDYADSHKSKRWQRYAAATAASCMKAFLDVWVPSSTTRQPQDVIPYTSNTDFVGREDILAKLKEQLAQSRDQDATSQPRASLFGLGGVGKTQIALAHVYWHRERFATDSIYWVHASNAERFRQSYTLIAQRCHIPGHTDPNVDILTLVKDWLAGPASGRWLLIIDNADDTQLFFGKSAGDAEQAAREKSNGNFSAYIPECAHGALLITTRNKQAGFRLTKGCLPIEVPPMSATDSTNLLHEKLQGVKKTPDELSKLSAALGHLPLALVQAAAFIHETGNTVARYLELLKKSDENVVTLLTREVVTVGRDSEAPRALSQTWILSFQQVEQQHPLSCQILSFLSLFDMQDIPSSFIQHFCEEEPDGKRYDEVAMEEAMGVLIAFSFVTRKQNNTFDMHRLLHLVTRKWLINKGTIRWFWAAALRTIAHSYPDGTFEDRGICSTLSPHAKAVLDSSYSISHDEKLSEASLLHCVASHFGIEGRWTEGAVLNKMAETIRREILGESHPDTLRSMTNLASSHEKLGRLKEAECLNFRVLTIRSSTLGSDDAETLTSLGKLASNYWNLGQHKDAEKLEAQVVEARKRVLGPKHPDTLSSMAELASTLSEQRRWADAEKLQVQVIEYQKQVLGTEHPETLKTMSDLVSTYNGLGRAGAAEELGVQVLDTRKRTFGPEHPETLALMANLAIVYWSQDQLPKAEALEKQVVDAYNNLFGTAHPSTLSAMYNLALTYKKQGLLDKTVVLQEEVLKHREYILGAEHRDTLASKISLAKTYYRQEKWELAAGLESQLLEHRIIRLGPEHADTLAMMADLAITLQKLEAWDKAEQLQTRVLAARQRLLGPEHAETRKVGSDLEVTLQHMKQAKRSEAGGLTLRDLNIGSE